MHHDQWGEPVVAGSAATVEAWNDAWDQALHFSGDPFGRLEAANVHDEAFALGSVFVAAYRILSGVPPDSAEVVTELARATDRARSLREQGHAAAAAYLANGEFTRAAQLWDELAAGTHDLAAVRLAHDVYLHTGNDQGRLRSSSAAISNWSEEDRGWNFVASQHAFSLEEVGRYDEALQFGHAALESDPADTWALHALAHVFESTDDQIAALDLLQSRMSEWRHHELLAVHIWWHLSLRLMVASRFDEVLAIHDRLVASATTMFRLCDLASMLWRLELEGIDVGDRWIGLADSFAVRPERHTVAFLELHFALVFARRPDHRCAQPFFDGVTGLAPAPGTENGEIFANVVRPLTEAIRLSETDPASAAQLIDSIGDDLWRIGGSIAQRDLVVRTRQAIGPQPQPMLPLERE